MLLTVSALFFCDSHIEDPGLRSHAALNAASAPAHGMAVICSIRNSLTTLAQSSANCEPTNPRAKRAVAEINPTGRNWLARFKCSLKSTQFKQMSARRKRAGLDKREIACLFVGIGSVVRMHCQ